MRPRWIGNEGRGGPASTAIGASIVRRPWFAQRSALVRAARRHQGLGAENRACGVDVSIGSRIDRKLTPHSSRSSITCNRWLTDRARWSSRTTTSTSQAARSPSSLVRTAAPVMRRIHAPEKSAHSLRRAVRPFERHGPDRRSKRVHSRSDVLPSTKGWRLVVLPWFSRAI